MTRLVRWAAFGCFAAAGLMLSSCGNGTGPEAHHGVEGTVSDSRSRASVVGAAVVCAREHSESSSLGHYHLPDVPTGSHLLRCGRAGYVIYEASVSVPDDGVLLHDVVLVPAPAPSQIAHPRIKSLEPGPAPMTMTVIWTMGQDEEELPDFGGYRVWVVSLCQTSFPELATQHSLAEHDSTAPDYWGFEPFEVDSLRSKTIWTCPYGHPHLASVTAFTSSNPAWIDTVTMWANLTGPVYPPESEWP